MVKPDDEKTSKYVAKVTDKNGNIPYSDEEHHVWHDLIVRQKKLIQNRACQEFIDGLDILKMSDDEIPQPNVLSKRLYDKTNWVVAPVPALISYDRFWQLLSERKFPAASFIRSREELDYLQEPDIFHEYFGHCPLLTDQVFADFTQRYGAIARKADKKDHARLARLYWFTVEFGLINTSAGLRSYGGGILSSAEETVYALESDIPQRRHLDFVDALRTPYRIDILQTVYFVIDSYDELYHALDVDLFELIAKARKLGEHEPTYPTE